MLRNYFKIALRSLVKNKVYSFNIICRFSVGISLIILITTCTHKNTHWQTNSEWEKLINDERAQVGSITQVDDSVIDYMKKHNVPGLSIAIAKDDKLIYVKAYGYADVMTHEKVTVNSLFRLASVSKPITSIAIMKLIQDGKLSLNSKVFGEGGILGNDYGSLPDDPNIKKITINHLLHHTSGWSRNTENPTIDDPTFIQPSLNSSELIAWVFSHQSLKTTPGSTFAYTNFNFFLLGRVIEKVSGQRYVDYVNSAILNPIGITDMQIGGNSKTEKKTNEVVYYEENNEPYTINLSRMDAGAGWIASAKDLIKLIAVVDGLSFKKDILNSSILQTMLTSSSANKEYACGWRLATSGNLRNWYHFGELMGTATLLAHTHLGYSWAILTNTGYQNEQTHTDFDQILWNAINNPATKWPDKDLF
jgi:D-alanyl-D-alanine carboxypeptidase